MSMRLLNGYPVYKVSWIKNGPLGEFWIYIIDPFFLQCREDEWVETIPRRTKFWAQSGLKCFTLGNKSFSKISTISILL